MWGAGVGGGVHGSRLEGVPEKPKRNLDDLVLTPMPGTLVSLNVKEGDDVAEGQEVAVVEAMKMQNQLRAPRSGKIAKIHFKVRNFFLIS